MHPHFIDSEDPIQEKNTSANEVNGHALEKKDANNHLPTGFFFSDEGLMYQLPSDQDKESPPLFICSRLEVTAHTRDDVNQDHGRLLEFSDVDGVHHSWSMPMKLLAGDGTAYREELLSRGLIIPSGQRPRNLLSIYIQSCKPMGRARCVPRTGWYNSCFVLPDQTISPGETGLNDGERIMIQNSSMFTCDYTKKGSLEDWRVHVSSLCLGNSRLVFSVCVALAAPLLHLLGLESGGFHFRGASSSGKTTLLKVAGSVWGGKGYVQRWRATANGLEAVAANHNDSLLCLDEISQIDGSAAGEIAYMLANGMGKARSDRYGGARKPASWNLLILSTGELSLADHMTEAGKKVRAGQEVRLLDIPAQTNAYGVFENLHGRPNGSIFSMELVKASSMYYGTASREWLKLLVQQKDELALESQEFIKEFVSSCNLKDADGQVFRAAQRFALVAMAGEIATAWGITGWNERDATLAARECFYAWQSSRGGVVSQEELAILSQVRRFFELHGESRFTRWESNQENSKTINRVGFRRDFTHGTEYFVFPEAFKNDIASGFDPKLVAKVCLKNGLLQPGGKGEATRSERLPHISKNIRCYRFTHKVLGSDEVEGENDSK